MINVVGNLARGRPPRRPRPPLGDGGRHQDGCPAAARARAAVKPFECCRPHRFRPGTKASNTPNLEATTGQTPKELQSGFEFTGEEIDARDIAARPREGRDQTAPDRDPRRVPKTIRWASMPAASSRGRSAPTRFSTAGGSKLQLVSCSSNAKGLAAGLAPTSGQVVTQIQSASPRPVSAVRILYAQPRSPVSARQKVNVARTMASERARGCCCACFVFALQWKPLIAQRVGGGVVGLLSPLGQQGGRSETMAC